MLLGLIAAIAACDYKPFYDEGTGRRTTDLPPPTGLEAEFDRPSTPLPPRAEPLIVPGTDTTIRQRAGQPTALGAPRQGEVTLNFVDADLREVLRAILGDILGANYVVDPKVQGTVTFRTSTPMPISGLMTAVENMLSLNGAALIATGSAFKIVPAEQITRSGGPVQVRSSGAKRDPQSGVVIVPLKYASAEQIRTLLEPFAPPGGTVSADPDRNALLLAGAGAELASMVDIAETFDVDVLAGKSFGLFPVQTTNAVTMVENLEQVFGGQDEGPLSGIIRLVPIERLNAVLVIAARAAYLDKVKTWIAHLDSGEEEMQQIFVYYAKNSRAADLAAVLGEIFPAGETSRRSTLAPGLIPTQVRSSRLNRRSAAQSAGEIRLTALSDGEEDLKVGQVQTEPPGQQRRPGQETQPRQQQNGGTGALRRQTNRGRLDGGGAETLDVGPYGEVRIVADEVKNAVVVYAKPRAYRLIEQAMRKLDNVPLQVLIEATILEVVLNDALRYGVEWFFHEGDFGFTSQTRGTLGLTPGAISNSWRLHRRLFVVERPDRHQRAAGGHRRQRRLLAAGVRSRQPDGEHQCRRSGPDLHPIIAERDQRRRADRQLRRVCGHRRDPDGDPARQRRRPRQHGHRSGCQRCGPQHHLADRFPDHSTAPDRKLGGGPARRNGGAGRADPRQPLARQQRHSVPLADPDPRRAVRGAEK